MCDGQREGGVGTGGENWNIFNSVNDKNKYIYIYNDEVRTVTDLELYKFSLNGW